METTTNGIEEEPFFWFDIRHDIIASLELLANELPKIPEHPRHWKWVFISLHNSLQACMALALSGANNYAVIKRDHRSIWEKMHEALFRGEKPKYQAMDLDSVPNLYERIKLTKWMERYVGSKIFIPNQTQDESVKKLHQHRNEFIHFMPTLTSGLFIQDLYAIVFDCFSILEFLIYDSENIDWHHYEPSVFQKADEFIKKIKNHLLSLRTTFNPSQEGPS